MYSRVVAGTETPRHLSPSTSGCCKLKVTGLNCYHYWRQLVSTVLNLPDLLLYWVGKLLQFRPTLDLSWYFSLILPSWTRPDTPHTQRTILWRVLVCGLWCFCITHCSSKTWLISALQDWRQAPGAIWRCGVHNNPYQQNYDHEAERHADELSHIYMILQVLHMNRPSMWYHPQSSYGCCTMHVSCAQNVAHAQSMDQYSNLGIMRQMMNNKNDVAYGLFRGPRPCNALPTMSRSLELMSHSWPTMSIRWWLGWSEVGAQLRQRNLDL